MAFHNVPPNGFPDLPDVEELEAVQKDVQTLKTTTTSQGEAITALQTAVGTKAAKADIAPTFSAEGNYAVGDLVYYEGTLYKCTTAHEAAAWDAEDFTATSVDDEVSGLNSKFTDLKYHKIAESASTGTWGTKLQSLATAYNSLSLAQRRSALLVVNEVDIYQPVNCSGNWFNVWVESTGAYASRYGIDGSAYAETGGVITDSSSVENSNVFALWVCEP